MRKPFIKVQTLDCPPTSFCRAGQQSALQTCQNPFRFWLRECPCWTGHKTHAPEHVIKGCLENSSSLVGTPQFHSFVSDIGAKQKASCMTPCLPLWQKQLWCLQGFCWKARSCTLTTNSSRSFTFSSPHHAFPLGSNPPHVSGRQPALSTVLKVFLISCSSPLLTMVTHLILTPAELTCYSSPGYESQLL